MLPNTQPSMQIQLGYKPKSAIFPPLTGVFSQSFFELAVHGTEVRKMNQVKHWRGDKRLK